MNQTRFFMSGGASLDHASGLPLSKVHFNISRVVFNCISMGTVGNC